ncbi:MAG: hypothetical protein ACRCZI_07660 [Cetobacterium sp.]
MNSNQATNKKQSISNYGPIPQQPRAKTPDMSKVTTATEVKKSKKSDFLKKLANAKENFTGENQQRPKTPIMSKTEKVKEVKISDATIELEEVKAAKILKEAEAEVAKIRNEAEAKVAKIRNEAAKQSAPAPVPATAPVPAKQSAPVPAKQSAPAPVPAKQSAPAPVPAKQSAPAPVPAPVPVPAPAKQSAPAIINELSDDQFSDDEIEKLQKQLDAEFQTRKSELKKVALKQKIIADHQERMHKLEAEHHVSELITSTTMPVITPVKASNNGKEASTTMVNSKNQNIDQLIEKSVNNFENQSFEEQLKNFYEPVKQHFGIVRELNDRNIMGYYGNNKNLNRAMWVYFRYKKIRCDEKKSKTFDPDMIEYCTNKILQYSKICKVSQELYKSNTSFVDFQTAFVRKGAGIFPEEIVFFVDQPQAKRFGVITDAFEKKPLTNNVITDFKELMKHAKLFMERNQQKK